MIILKLVLRISRFRDCFKTVGHELHELARIFNIEFEKFDFKIIILICANLWQKTNKLRNLATQFLRTLEKKAVFFMISYKSKGIC